MHKLIVFLFDDAASMMMPLLHKPDSARWMCGVKILPPTLLQMPPDDKFSFLV